MRTTTSANLWVECVLMDLLRLIKELREEKERIDTAIAALETVIARGGSPASQKRGRGRTGMPEAEKAEVSRRMKKYWRLRKRQKKVQ